MRRDELAWALTATLPHCGTSESLATVGLVSGLRSVFLFATDRYSVGIARIPGTDVNAVLPKSEAADLLRFIRPGKVAEQSGEVEALVAENGLHIAIQSESAVFETVGVPFGLGDLTSRLAVIEALPDDYERLEYNPSLMVKFAKAKRDVADRLRVYPKRANDRNGVALVTVGNDFLGAIAGLSYTQEEAVTVAGFLGLEGEVAA